MKTNKYLLMAATLLLSSQAHAAPGCTAANLNGSYVFYQNNLAAANPQSSHCKITILNGEVSGACAFTDSVGGFISPSFNGPVSGIASINTNCSAGMQIDFSTAQNGIVSSFFDLQFTADKQSFIGQWTNSLGQLGTLAGTRYSSFLPATPAQ